MDRALEEIEFLTLSANRIEVLDALREGRFTRGELADRIDASQPTLGRVLGDLGDRGWVVYEEGGYTASATGRMVAAGFTDLLGIVDAELELREVIEWLPTDAIDIDLRQLAGGTITRPSQTRPSAPVTRALDLLENASEARICSHAFNERSLGVIRRRTRANEQSFEGVFSPSALDALAHDSELHDALADLIATPGVELYHSDREIPVALTIADSTVHLLLRDEEGLLRAALDTDDPDVCSWAETTYERYRADATRLDRDALDAR